MWRDTCDRFSVSKTARRVADSHCAVVVFRRCCFCLFFSVSLVFRLRSVRFASTPTSASRCTVGCMPSARRAT